MAILTLTATQEADVEAKITDARGNPAQVQNPQWVSTEPQIVEVVDTPDPLKVVLKAVGPTDEASQVQFTADADLGSGVLPIIGLLDVVVTAGQAMIVEVTAGTPREQGSAPTP
jgi:hypothetical protein